MSRMECVYIYIYDYWRDHGYSPTQQEIMEACDVNNLQLRSALNRLKKINAITYAPNKWRGIAIAQQQPASDTIGEWEPVTTLSSNGRVKRFSSTSASRRPSPMRLSSAKRNVQSRS